MRREVKRREGKEGKEERMERKEKEEMGVEKWKRTKNRIEKERI